VENLGLPGLPVVIIPHPVGGLTAEEVREKADHIIEDIVARFTQPPGKLE